MNFCARRFNLYLLLLAVALLPAAGCQSGKSKKKTNQTASMRFHIESRGQLPGSGRTVSVMRSRPVLVTITDEPALTEANIAGAGLLETPGGYAIEVKFDEVGTWTLEQFTSANSGRHFVIFSQWSEKGIDSRWLAAPLITRRIPNGLLSFTPDATKEEAQQIVTGLNNMAKKIAKQKMK